MTDGRCALMRCVVLVSQRSVRGGAPMSSQADRSPVRRQVDPEATQLVEPARRPAARHPPRGGAARRARAPQRRHPLRVLRGAQRRHTHPRTVRVYSRSSLIPPLKTPREYRPDLKLANYYYN